MGESEFGKGGGAEVVLKGQHFSLSTEPGARCHTPAQDREGAVWKIPPRWMVFGSTGWGEGSVDIGRTGSDIGQDTRWPGWASGP